MNGCVHIVWANVDPRRRHEWVCTDSIEEARRIFINLLQHYREDIEQLELLPNRESRKPLKVYPCAGD